MNIEKVRKEFNRYWWDKEWLTERIGIQKAYLNQFNPDKSARNREIFFSAKGLLDQYKAQLTKINSLR